jgi:hypothetical protein
MFLREALKPGQIFSPDASVLKELVNILIEMRLQECSVNSGEAEKSVLEGQFRQSFPVKALTISTLEEIRVPVENSNMWSGNFSLSPVSARNE